MAQGRQLEKEIRVGWVGPTISKRLADQMLSVRGGLTVTWYISIWVIPGIIWVTWHEEESDVIRGNCKHVNDVHRHPGEKMLSFKGRISVFNTLI